MDMTEAPHFVANNFLLLPLKGRGSEIVNFGSSTNRTRSILSKFKAFWSIAYHFNMSFHVSSLCVTLFHQLYICTFHTPKATAKAKAKTKTKQKKHIYLFFLLLIVNWNKELLY